MNLQDNLRKNLQDLKLNFSEPLNRKEMEKLLEGFNLEADVPGLRSQSDTVF